MLHWQFIFKVQKLITLIVNKMVSTYTFIEVGEQFHTILKWIKFIDRKLCNFFKCMKFF